MRVDSHNERSNSYSLCALEGVVETREFFVMFHVHEHGNGSTESKGEIYLYIPLDGKLVWCMGSL